MSLKSSLRSREDIHVIAAVVAVSAWGVGPIFNKLISVSTPSIVFYRVLLGVPLMVGAAYLNGGRIDAVLLRKATLPGVLFAVSMITGFASVKMTSIANATLVTTLQPVLVLFVAPKLFGERITARKLFFSSTSMVGVLVVVLAAASTSGAHLSGDLLAVLNVVLWTGYFVMAKTQRMDGVHSWSFIAAIFVCAAVVVVPFGLIASNDLSNTTVEDWWYLVAMSLVPGLIGHGLMTWSQSHVDVSLASLLGLLSPVISAVLAWIILDQSLTLLQLVGGVIVLVSLALLVKSQTTSEVISVDHSG